MPPAPTSPPISYRSLSLNVDNGGDSLLGSLPSPARKSDLAVGRSDKSALFDPLGQRPSEARLRSVDVSPTAGSPASPRLSGQRSPQQAAEERGVAKFMQLFKRQPSPRKERGKTSESASGMAPPDNDDLCVPLDRRHSFAVSELPSRTPRTSKAGEDGDFMRRLSMLRVQGRGDSGSELQSQTHEALMSIRKSQLSTPSAKSLLAGRISGGGEDEGVC